MTSNMLKVAAFALLIAAPGAAYAQGVAGGAKEGADNGAAAAGPVGGVIGGVVGGVVGGVTGGIDGLLGVDQRPRFHEYVVREHHPSYRYDHEVVMGATLPREGVQYYDVPADYGVRGYRYAIVNDQTVLVDARTGRIVQIVN